MGSVSGAPENSLRSESTPASFQPRNRPPLNRATGSSSSQSESDRLINQLAHKLGYPHGNESRSRENSPGPSARRGASATPTPAQSDNQDWRLVGGRPATGRVLICAAHREMDRRRDAQPNPTYISAERFPIEKLLGWRIYDGDSVVINVRWVDGSPDSWEPEEVMHIDSAQTLLNFWRRLGGRHKATGLREHRVLRVLKEKQSRTDKDSRLFQCQWIGLPASDRYTTWLSLEEVTDIALGQWLEFVTGLNDIFG
ncbi:hypothetical protein FGADI_167 [Fusarium gaditjirri]|uniref:Chromo domain-containing protein n=1 Tax=Fusarium gaditjirri TaxID=282569 RepID=A0A8H4TP50_9HYPO|nr:hypothetical protein FGADI_167 [Fusarium gaditjirri]